MTKKSLHTPECFINTKHVIAVLLCMLLASCAASAQRKPMARLASGDTMVNDLEYSDAGYHIVAALSSGDAEIFNRAIHKKTLLDRTFHGMSQDSHVIKETRAGLETVLDEAGIVMTKNLGENTRLTFVRSRSIEGEHRALVRVDMGDRGLSYIDFVLGKDKEGTVKIIDWHDYAQGQLYSDSLRQALVLMLPQDEMTIATLLKGPAVDKETVEQFSELARLSRGKKYAQWLEKYEDLPDSLKYNRMVLVTRVLITGAMGSELDYRLALKDVHTFIGDDPTLSLMLIDHYFYERDYNAAHTALDRLDKYTGGDAAIDLLKANVCLAEKNYSESIRYAQNAIQNDAAFEDAYWTLLAVSVFSKQYEIAINTLSQLERHFGYAFEPDEIARLNGYEEFASSSVFADWKYGRTYLIQR